jgi:hypothetical protein
VAGEQWKDTRMGLVDPAWTNQRSTPSRLLTRRVLGVELDGTRRI